MKEPLKTEVTSIANEEKQGATIEVPQPQDLVNRASASLLTNLKILEMFADAKQGSEMFLSKKAMKRVLLAIIDLPSEGVPVKLRGEAEKKAFAIGQRAIADRFLITQHYINQEIRQARTAEAEKAKETTSTETEQETENE